MQEEPEKTIDWYYQKISQNKLMTQDEINSYFKEFENLKRKILEVLKNEYKGEISFENHGAIDYKELKSILKEFYKTSNKQVKSVKNLERKADEIKNTLTNSNLRLVFKVVNLLRKEFDTSKYSLEDAVQEGTIGLMRAIDKYDYRKGYKFSTYAYWWIMQSITRGYAEYDGVIRLPIHFREKIKKFRAVVHKGVRDLSELEKEFGIGKKSLERMLIYFNPMILYLDTPLDKDSEDSKKILDMIPNNKDSPYLELYEKEFKTRISQILKTLDQREEFIIKMRFGIDVDRKTLREVGEMLGLSRERIRQIEKKSIKKLKRKAKQHLRDFR